MKTCETSPCLGKIFTIIKLSFKVVLDLIYDKIVIRFKFYLSGGAA